MGPLEALKPIQSHHSVNPAQVNQREVDVTSQGESWRDRLMAAIGPPLLTGARLGDWLELLHENQYAIGARYSARAALITMSSLFNTIISRYEMRRYGYEVSAADIKPPLFVLGHWRSGTTLLHNLIVIDRRFAYPTLYQVLFPHTFLTTESFLPRLTQPFLPRKRPTDNVRFTLDVPYEEEFALCVTTFLSSYMKMIFPKREAYYARYLSLRDASTEEIERWSAALNWFLKKLTVRYGRPLALKSPTHTARIGVLLRMFPEAKFVHIHRNPYAVFKSTRKTMAASDIRQCLQYRDFRDFDEIILNQYVEMYNCYFEELPLIPEGHYHQIRFEDLERDPVGQIREMYRALSLPEFGEVEPELSRYVESLSGYNKNEFADLPEGTRQRIAHKWRRCFDEWGYAV